MTGPAALPLVSGWACTRALATSRVVEPTTSGSTSIGRLGSPLLGTAGIAFEPERLTVRYGDLVVAEGGVTAPVDHDALSAYMDQEHLEVTADLGIGDGCARVLTNDLTHAYVDENMGTS